MEFHHLNLTMKILIAKIHSSHRLWRRGYPYDVTKAGGGGGCNHGSTPSLEPYPLMKNPIVNYPEFEFDFVNLHKLAKWILMSIILSLPIFSVYVILVFLLPKFSHHCGSTKFHPKSL